MTLAELVDELEGRDVRFWEEGEQVRFSAPPGVLTEASKSMLVQHKAELLDRLRTRGGTQRAGTAPSGRRGPFPLTPLQQAYWVGEQKIYDLSAPAYFYEEYESPDLDRSRLERAINQLVQRHGMLRAVIDLNGEQVIQEPSAVPWLAVDHADLSGLPEEVVAERIASTREQMQREAGPLDRWPLFRVHVHRLPRSHRIHFLGRFIIGDGWSWTLFLEDLASFYADSWVAPLDTAPSFRDYVAYLERSRSTETYRAAERYWRSRAASLPGPPDLPLTQAMSAASSSARLARRTLRLPRDKWKALRTRAAQHGMSADVVLCCVLAEALAIWSKSARFTLALMFANRPDMHRDIGLIFGNFSATLLLEVDFIACASFEARARLLQSRLVSDLDHSGVTGVEVGRWARQSQDGATGALSAPVVFASMLNVGGDRESRALARLGWSKLYNRVVTPQVLLDNQVLEDDGELVVNFDAVEDRFRADVLDQFVAAYTAFLNALADGEDAWREAMYGLLPGDLVARRLKLNETHAPAVRGLLHDCIAQNAPVLAGAVAVETGRGKVSYRDLYHGARRLGSQLIAAGVRAGEYVGIAVPKCTEQLCAVLATLLARAVYVPLAADMPAERLRDVAGQCALRVVLVGEQQDTRPYAALGLTTVTSSLASSEQGYTDRIPAADGDPDSLAYVIFTSGSTGIPKGVMIRHTAALNTILDVNRRFGVGATDKVLAVAALGFDLSVYDIFGTLIAGATIVLPSAHEAADAAGLVALIRATGVTVLNCVPAVMEMIIEHAEGRGLRLDSLRLAMLSGDWIPVTLPDRIRAMSNARVVSLGGATEAAIWSCYYEVSTVPPAWRSIPYGRPLTNQTLYVLNERLEQCPDHVPGEIYIGGAGLADGYHLDKEKTDRAFIVHPRTGSRLYRTGDWGLYLPDGNIEFLGREDAQVKVRGYRVELGEIEAHLLKHEHIGAAVVLVEGERSDSKRLVAYVEPRDGSKVDEDSAKAFLGDKVPGYMIPTRWVTIEAMPVNANGKIDRARLRQLPANAAQGSKPSLAPRTVSERELLAIWQEVLQVADISADSDFFALGGNSLNAVRLMRIIEQRFGHRLSASILFEANTLAKLAGQLDALQPARPGQHLVRIGGRRGRPLLVLVHPIGGEVMCYAPLVQELADRFDIYGLRCVDADGASEPASIRAMAACYARELREALGTSPVQLCGWSMGALIAYEIAAELRFEEQRDARVVMIDPWIVRPDRQPSVEDASFADFLRDLSGGKARASHGGEPDDKQSASTHEDDESTLQRYFAMYRRNRQALLCYQPSGHSVRVNVLRAADARMELSGELVPWSSPADSDERVLGDHYSMLNPPLVSGLAQRLASIVA